MLISHYSIKSYAEILKSFEKKRARLSRPFKKIESTNIKKYVIKI